MLFLVYHYFFNHEGIAGRFDYFRYPSYLVYPLVVDKTLGLAAIWGNFSNSLREWVYACFFFNILLASVAHSMTDGEGHFLSVVALLATLIRYFTAKQVRSSIK